MYMDDKSQKIYNLAKEAGLIEFEPLSWNPDVQAPNPESVAKASRFAELILRECCQKLETDGMVEVAMEIKENFGIE